MLQPHQSISRRALPSCQSATEGGIFGGMHIRHMQIICISWDNIGYLESLPRLGDLQSVVLNGEQ
jgi:hypothetical protein